MGTFDPPQSPLPNGQIVPSNKKLDLNSASTRSTAMSATIQSNSPLQHESQAFGMGPPARDLDRSHKVGASIPSQPILLPFSTLGLIGRSKETQTLQEIVDAIVPAQDKHQPLKVLPEASARSHVPQHTMALISGPSGSGKSALTMDFQQQCFDRHAFFVTGKFDLKQMEEPYSGIKAALAELCRQMLALQQGSDACSAAASASVYSKSTSADESVGEDPRRFSDLQSLFTNGLSTSELQALSKVMPDILKVVDLPSSGTSNKPQRSPSMTSNMSNSAVDIHLEDKAKHRMGYREQSERLKFVLQRFIQISCQFCPVVMVIDDLQWGDKPSMDLLKSWMFMDIGGSRADDGAGTNDSTADHHSLLFMGCFRSEASEHSPVLQDTIEELKSAQEARSINIVEISLADMKVSQVHELVCGLLLPSSQSVSSNDGGSITSSTTTSTNSTSSKSSPAPIIGGHETLALAHLVHKRTGGNVFFVKQFLQQLCYDGLIYYDQNEHRWAWKSEAELLEKSAATTNIVDMMKHQLTQIEAARQILPIAACLGATFSASTLTMVIRSLSIHSDHATFFRQIFDIPRILKDAWVSDILRSCEQAGLIESYHESRNMRTARKKMKKRGEPGSGHQGINIHHGMFSFVHDKVQEASFSLIPIDCVTELQYRVGVALSSCLTQSELEDSIFMVASLLNVRHDLVPHTNRGDRRMKIAMLNKMAGERAVSCGAFQSALSYFKMAISLLPEDHWESQFEDSLNLYSSVAECSFVTFNMEEVNTYATRVINQDCPILDKIRAYHILIDATVSEAENNKDQAPFNLCLFVLSELGYKFPRNSAVQGFATLRGMLKMKRCVPKWTLQQFDDLPVCTDAKELAITKTLSKLVALAINVKPDIVPLVSVKLVQRIFDHGIAQYALPSFALVGLIVGYFMGDFQGAQKLAKISIRLTDQMESQETRAATLCTSHLMCLHWANPIEDSKEGYLEAYRVGMAHGAIEPATWSMYYSIFVDLLTGTPLPDVERDLSRYAKLMKDFHQNHQHRGCAMLLQVIHNLQGKTENRTLLVGDVYDEEADLKALEHESDHQRPLSIDTMKLHAAAYLGDFAIGAKIAAETYNERLKKHPGMLVLPPAIFQSGLCCYATCSAKAAPPKLLRKYLKTAKKCRAKLREWQEKGNPNWGHYLAILDAEHCIWKGQYESAIKHYAIAIALVQSHKYIQDEALVHERLADHLLKGDSFRRSSAEQCMRKAIELTEQCGASVKARELREKYSEFVAGPNATHRSY